MSIQNQSGITYNAEIPDEGTVAGNLTSNTVSTENLSEAVTKILKSDKIFAREGDIVHNTVTVTNNSTTKLFSTFISDITPAGASNVEGSVKVNGVAQPNRNMYSGFYLPDLNPGESLTVEYDLKIDNPMTTTPITDSPQFQYWVKDSARGDVRFVGNTNSVTINVISDKLTVVKSVDKTFAAKGETLTYTITITNKGNVEIRDINFKDSIPAGTTFVPNSIKIDETSYPDYNPETGFAIRNLSPDENITVKFEVKVN